MKLIYLFALVLVACGKVEDFKAPPQEADHSSVLLEEKSLNEHGCRFIETADHRLLASCQARASFEEYYDQQITVLDYHEKSDSFLRSPEFSQQNRTTKLELLRKGVASLVSSISNMLNKNHFPQVESQAHEVFYMGLLRIADRYGVVVRFDRSKEGVIWSIDRRPNASPVPSYVTQTIRKKIESLQVPQSDFMFSVLDSLEEGM